MCVNRASSVSRSHRMHHRHHIVALLLCCLLHSAWFLPAASYQSWKKKKTFTATDCMQVFSALIFFSFLLLFIYCDSCTINILRKKNNDNSDKQPSLSIKTITTELRRIRADEKRSIQFNSYVYELPINVEDSLFWIFLSFDKPFNHRHTASVQFYPTTTTWSPLRIYTPTIVRSPLILWL